MMLYNSFDRVEEFSESVEVRGRSGFAGADDPGADAGNYFAGFGGEPFGAPLGEGGGCGGEGVVPEGDEGGVVGGGEGEGGAW